MTTKVSADMYPVNEIREEFTNRIRTTAFIKLPDVFVSFKFFGCLIPMIPDMAKAYNSKIIEKALSGISFFTVDGFHKLEEVDYMFTDADGLIVAVLDDGTPLNVKYPPESELSGNIKEESALECYLSTRYLKTYFIDHKDEFPYLYHLTALLNQFGIGNYTNYKTLRTLAAECSTNRWIISNIENCIVELSNLLDNASFIMDYKPKSKRSSNITNISDK